jgi:hypothetical protein
MDILEHLHRIEEKLNYIIEATGLEEINNKISENPNQLHFPWFQDNNSNQESDVFS